MPSIPKWLADTFEKVSSDSFHPVTVTQTHYYTPQLKLVRFEGDIGRTNFTAGNVVEFRVSDSAFRHYTPSLYDAGKQVCEVIFYLHHKGVGSRWAEELTTGDKTKLLGPGGKMAYQPEWPRQFAFGDETSLGLLLCLEDAARQHNQRFLGLAELEKEHLHWTDYWQSATIKSVCNSFEQPAQPAISILSQWPEALGEHLPETYFYLTGRAKSIQQLRKFLIANGASNRQIKTYPYWAEGKQGL